MARATSDGISMAAVIFNPLFEAVNIQ